MNVVSTVWRIAPLSRHYIVKGFKSFPSVTAVRLIASTNGHLQFVQYRVCSNVERHEQRKLRLPAKQYKTTVFMLPDYSRTTGDWTFT